MKFLSQIAVRGGVSALVALTLALALLTSCRAPARVAEGPAPAGFRDRTFHSGALGRQVTYRVWGPAAGRMHVVYLLHGNGQSYAEWSRWSRMAELAPKDWLLVMPEGGSGYWVNSATVAGDRYEDFLTRDLIADAERGVEVADRAIVGNSMGGYGALVLGMRHPKLYGFVGSLSAPVDYAERGFFWHRWGQWMAARAIFGKAGSATRRAGDPLVLARGLDAGKAPMIWMSCGDEEGLMGPNRRLDAVLTGRGVRHVFVVGRGGHEWGQWNGVMAGLVAAMGR